MKKIISVVLRYVKIMFIVIAIAIMALLVVLIFGLSPCKNEKKNMESPSHEYIVSLKFKNCATINTDSLWVTIFRKNHLALPPWGKDVFMATNCSSIELTWIKNNTLQIAGECDPLNINTQEDSFGKIKIKYLLKKKT